MGAASSRFEATAALLEPACSLAKSPRALDFFDFAWLREEAAGAAGVNDRSPADSDESGAANYAAPGQGSDERPSELDANAGSRLDVLGRRETAGETAVDV